MTTTPTSVAIPARRPPPLIIPYTRFSSARQAHGHSLERQLERAREWCGIKGWQLNESLHYSDLGVSAYRGKHRHKGALGCLLDAAKSGRIPTGTYLLIEQFDRISREDIIEASDLLRSIVNAGITVVTLMDGGREYTRESLKDVGTFMYTILLFSRAHEESKTKGDRIRKQFSSARAAGVKSPFGTGPGWLKRKDKHSQWEIIEERAESVRKVFEYAASGFGGPSIAKIANAEGWTIPTRDTKQKTTYWHAKLPAYLLKQIEVTGRHELYYTSGEDLEKSWKGIPTGHVFDDYYPRIVSDELWHRTRNSVASRLTHAGGRDENYFNIFSKLLKCGCCGSSMQRKSENKGSSKAQYVCDKKRAGITNCRSANAFKTDYPLLEFICSVGGDALGLGYDKEAVQADIDVCESKLADASAAAARIASAIAIGGDMPELLSELQKLRATRAELEEKLLAARKTLAMPANSLLDTSYAEKVAKHLYLPGAEHMRVRADCNTRLRRAISKIYLFAYDVAIVIFKSEPNMRYLLPLSLKNKRKDKRVFYERYTTQSLELPYCNNAVTEADELERPPV